MKIQQIRNATLKIEYNSYTILIDPWLQDKGTGFSATSLKPEMRGVKNPMNSLPIKADEILDGVDFCLVTHIHPDHFTEDYLPKNMEIIVQNRNDMNQVKQMGFENVSYLCRRETEIGNIKIIKTPCIHGDNPLLAK